ncbi:MAG TPA: two-component regulator propeller domain-containing protein [Bacteroidota bacterium]|nr:two-component regulator propeller domain-containing protein [Bacteroidota bacterium]
MIRSVPGIARPWSSAHVRSTAGRAGKRILVAFLLCCSLPLTAPAQHLFNFSHLTTKEGLSQSAVMCIFQDHEGFIWLGTQDGLNRFDGYSVKAFKHDPADSTSLGDNFIVSIAEDSTNTLWIGTLNEPNILNRFDRVTETFERVPAASVNLSRIPTSSIHSTYEDPAGFVWSGSIGKGLLRTNRADGSIKSFRHSAGDPGSLADDRVYSVFGDHTGAIWVGTHEGLDKFDPTTESFVHFRHDESNKATLSDSWVWPIMEDRTGTLWVGTFRGGLNRYDRSTGTFTHYRRSNTDPKALSDDRILSLYQDRSGMIWVGTGNHGADFFQPELSTFYHYQHDPDNSSSLLDNGISAAYVDREGTVWIGTRLGLDELDVRTDVFTHHTHDPALPRSIADNNVECLLEDHAGNLWIGLVSGGLDCYDRTTKTFSHLHHDPLNPSSLSDNRVYALCEDSGGTVWVGTYGGGLCRLDPSTRRFTNYLHSDSAPGSLGGQGVWALLKDHEGTLWVGTYGGGLDRFDPATGTFTHYRHDDANPSSLSDDIVVTLLEDHSGTIWVGTTGGLNKLDRRNGSFTRYRVQNGLPNDVILGLLEDSHGNLWLSTNKGISKFDPNAQTFQNYDENDGLQGNEFNQGAYARDPRTGEMYFGGSNGFNRFQPDSVRVNPYVPPVVFTSFTRYNTSVKEGKPIAGRGIDARREIILSYKDNVVNVEFSALSFYNNFKNLYAYKLEGYSDSWIQLGSDRRATFTNLDGGEYTLRVRGSNNDGIWNNAGNSLRIVVIPPWWKTRWAYGSYGFMILAVFYGIRRFEIKRREQKTQVRESELRAKAAEAEKRALEAENERQTKELEDARNLQLSLLPKDVPVRPDYDIAVFMKTATEVGGDYYDFHLDGDGYLHVAFGDATGHGMQAGTIVTLMKGLFLSDAARFDILTFFAHCSNAIKQIRLGRLFMALTLVRLKGNSVSLSSAGMPPVYLYRARDQSIEEILLKGMPLGAMKNFPYVLFTGTLDPDDVLLLLSDGLPEQKNAAGEMFDYLRVEETFKACASSAPGEVIQRLVQAGESWMTGAAQEDDVTIMVIRRKEQST